MENPEKFDRAISTLDRASKQFLAQMNTVVAKSVDEARDALKDAIYGRGGQIQLRLRSLSRQWLDTKAAKGWRMETLRRLDQYVEAIGTRHHGRKHYLGLPKRRYPGTKITYAQLALFLENGTRSMDPIPHWQPTKKWLVQRVRTAAGKEVARALSFR